ncbi:MULTISPECIES: DUF305 domain-containing protein [Bacillus]|uniref:DUF305 domain-containing protein n=1 Tax=Bacillus TaxID=1386 RepID=UPI0002E438C9|nr:MULTISPECIES: DUF305 domain-containing protein [Bacillus]
MKRIRNMSIMIMAFILCLYGSPTYSALDAKEEAYYTQYKTILQNMKKGMESAPTTGDATLDFLYEMIPHHEAAVLMSKNILKYGSNEQVKQIAGNIIKEQIKGIREMKMLLNQLKSKPIVDKKKEAKYLQGYKKAYVKMIHSMEKALPTGNIDKDFLEEMIPHHEGAIMMARNILKYTKNAELKAIAENITISQQKQLIEMKQLLKTLS